MDGYSPLYKIKGRRQNTSPSPLMIVPNFQWECSINLNSCGGVLFPLYYLAGHMSSRRGYGGGEHSCVVLPPGGVVVVSPGTAVTHTCSGGRLLGKPGIREQSVLGLRRRLLHDSVTTPCYTLQTHIAYSVTVWQYYATIWYNDI